MKSIIFDLDGTLLDSMGMWRGIDQRFLRSQGVEPPADISDIVKTMTIDRSAAYFAERFSLNMTPQEIKDRIGEMAAEEYQYHLPLKEGAADFLKAAAQHGIPCALASVTYPELLESALKRLQIRDFFSAVLTPEDGTEGKHSPEIYLQAARLLGTAPAETVVIEDACYAAKTAKNAGFYTVGFRDQYEREDWKTLESICDRMTDSWQDLLCSDFFRIFTE